MEIVLSGLDSPQRTELIPPSSFSDEIEITGDDESTDNLETNEMYYIEWDDIDEDES